MWLTLLLPNPIKFVSFLYITFNECIINSLFGFSKFFNFPSKYGCTVGVTTGKKFPKPFGYQFIYK
jgi:hypothetical protein